MRVCTSFWTYILETQHVTKNKRSTANAKTDDVTNKSPLVDDHMRSWQSDAIHQASAVPACDGRRQSITNIKSKTQNWRPIAANPVGTAALSLS